jgi:hypothetical protein
MESEGFCLQESMSQMNTNHTHTSHFLKIPFKRKPVWNENMLRALGIPS